MNNYHEFFDDVLDNIEKNNVLKRFEYFDEFYYNIKKIIKSAEFKSTGSGHIFNEGREFKFRRIILKKNSKIYIKSGPICTTISLNERYHTCIQCKYIVDRDTKKSSKSNNIFSEYEERRSSRSSNSRNDDSTYNNPSNPSNPFN